MKQCVRNQCLRFDDVFLFSIEDSRNYIILMFEKLSPGLPVIFSTLSL